MRHMLTVLVGVSETKTFYTRVPLNMYFRNTR